MCILFLALKQHKDFPMIICANRDESHRRRTQSAHFWEENPQLLAGKDLQAGGSWLGVNKLGRFAAITNFRTASGMETDKKSRGELVTKALEENSAINEQWLKHHSDDYNHFNLIYGSAAEMFCYSSSNKSQIQLSDGFHAISNGAIDDIWPKMANGQRQLERIVKSTEDIAIDKLLAVLQDQSQAKVEELPDTGLTVEWEQLLSSIFIRNDNYGTRSSSLILQNKQALLTFFEVEYDQTGQQLEQHHFEFSCITSPQQPL